MISNGRAGSLPAPSTFFATKICNFKLTFLSLHQVNTCDGMLRMIHSWVKVLRGLRIRVSAGSLLLLSSASPIAVGSRVWHSDYGIGVVRIVGTCEYVVSFEAGFESSTYKMYCCRVLCSLG